MRRICLNSAPRTPTAIIPIAMSLAAVAAGIGAAAPVFLLNW